MFPQAERYRLLRTVASGGMAQVLEAVACGLHGFERRVAIKRLLPQHARDGERRRMFLEEARIGSRLHHGGIVPIFDYGLIDGTEFLAMEFVDGLDALRAVIARAHSTNDQAMPEGIALHVAAEVAHALAYVHGLPEAGTGEAGIVHRDVSPPNILLSWNGDVRLSDFGIAQAGPGGEESLGGITGKLHYMAPEQARGEAVGTAADIYALGTTLHTLLGGYRVDASDVAGGERASQARQWGVSGETCALIADCLAQDPRERPAAAEVAARSGALASAHLGRDGRGALREWLEPVRARTLKQGTFDDLMGLSLVPTGAEGARAFTITRAATEHSVRRAGESRRPSWTQAVRALTVAAVVAATVIVWTAVHPRRQAIAADRAGRTGAPLTPAPPR
ncbi:MAG TPA: serine/threonine-protein kinase [Polyangia bacterium]|nr:serine/threonine-protein kinase [Polyangia bacterium]